MADRHTDNMNVKRDQAGYFAEEDLPEPESCDLEEDQCPSDDEEYSEAQHPPGTADDASYDLGEWKPDPADTHIGSWPDTPTEDTAEGEEPGGPEQRALWDRQQDLIEEDVVAGYKVEGFSDEQVEEIAEAIGEDAAEPLQEYPGGTSATAAPTFEEHGGFPDRDWEAEQRKTRDAEDAGDAD